MRPLSPRVAALLISIGLTASASQVSAFVQTVTARGCNPVHWARSCVFVTTDGEGASDLSSSDVERITQQAIQSWTNRTQDRSFLSIEYLAPSGPREVAVDGWQMIKFRSKTWCRPADAGGPEICYDPSAVALTTVSYVSDPEDPANDGRILDVDIEFNAVDNYFYDADTTLQHGAGDRRPMDLWNTLTHELGHLQGLEHTCRSSSAMSACTLQNDGNPVVDCKTVENGRATDPKLQAIYETTMYPHGEASETRKRKPQNDDVAGIVSIYPTANDPEVCTLPWEEEEEEVPTETPAVAQEVKQGCGMSRGTTSSGAWGWLAALALCGAARMRRS